MSEIKQKVKPSIVSVEARRPGGKGVLLTRTHLKFEGEEEEDDRTNSQSPDDVPNKGQYNDVSILFMYHVV